MRVAFVADLEGLGGAGIAASRLAVGLASRGVEVTRLSNNPARYPLGEPVTWESRYAGPPRGLEIALNGLRRAAPGLSRALGQADSARRLREAIKALRPDLVHVHSLHAGYWNHEALGALDPALPVVWTFHDCWGFAPEAHRFRDAEGREVRLRPDGDDRAAAQDRRLRYFRSRRRLGLHAASGWIARQAREALGLPVEVIPFGIDLETFAPRDRAAARATLGLPAEALLVGFSADNRQEPLKGFAVLRRALERLGDAGVECLALGDGPAGAEEIGKSRVRALGRVVHPSLLAAVYAAADLFVVPSLAEALGLVAIESIACGTPVAASATGGLPEVVAEGEAGFLFPPGDDAALAALLARFARDRGPLRALAGSCRARALARWDEGRQAEAMLALYRRASAQTEP